MNNTDKTICNVDTAVYTSPELVYDCLIYDTNGNEYSFNDNIFDLKGYYGDDENMLQTVLEIM